MTDRSSLPLPLPLRVRADGYPTAPIVEAVIDLRWPVPLDEHELDTVCANLIKHYPNQEKSAANNVRVDVVNEIVDVTRTGSVVRAVGEDTTEIALIRSDGFAASQLAPYRSWETFFGRFARDLTLGGELIHSRPVSRLAVRFINRIDIPLLNGIAHYEDYIAAHLKLPDQMDPVIDFYLNFTVLGQNGTGVATIQSAPMPSPMPDVGSFSLDIDLAKDFESATDERDIVKLLDLMRSEKNRLYQTMLTPLALEAFQ